MQCAQEMNSKMPEAHYSLGNVLQSDGKLAEKAKCSSGLF